MLRILIFVFCTVLTAQTFASDFTHIHEESDVRMNKEHTSFAMLWTSEAPTNESSYIFILSELNGPPVLRDVDFHEVTDDGWKNMGNPDGKTVAILSVTSNASISIIKKAIQLLRLKGHYNTVLICEE